MALNLILITILLFVIVLSGIFSGSETGMYQLSSLRLRLGIERKMFLFIVLGKAIKDRSALLFSMLIGNNLTHYVITSIVTVMLLQTFESEYEAQLVTTLLTAPVLFIFAELLPKSLFYHRADTLMPSLGPVIYFFHKAFCLTGVVGLLKWITKGLNRLCGINISSKRLIDTSQRPYIKGIFNQMEEEGFFSPVQKDIVYRLVKIPEINVNTIMTPLDSVETVDLQSDKKALLRKLKTCSYTRILVFHHETKDIVGWINIYQALASEEHFADVSPFLKQIKKIDSKTDIISAIRIMQQEKLRMLLVVKTSRSGQEIALGIVTMKDLAEEFLGELAEW